MAQVAQVDNEASAAPPVADLRVVVALVSAGLRVAVDLPMVQADPNDPVAPNDPPGPSNRLNIGQNLPTEHRANLTVRSC